jgi:hypothetical protein
MKNCKNLSAKKVILVMLIGSVVASALMGIIAILWGDFGWFEARILLTTLTITMASICGLACGAYLDTKRGRVLPTAGLVLNFLAAMAILVGMWTDVRSVIYWKLTASVSVFSVACTHLVLLSLARLSARFRWSLAAAYIIILGVALQIVLMILIELGAFWIFQLLGVLVIFAAAITILIPIFHRLSKAEVSAGREGSNVLMHADIDAEIGKLQKRILELERLKQQNQSHPC